MVQAAVPRWLRAIQKNPVFRFLSSVRLAIPTLATLAVVVGWGTILESRYAATYARWAIYERTWFWLLLGLIGVNVLFAALSRIPYQRHHTGFVITHVGILILLSGSFVTARYGIDGSLRLAEGNSGNTVELPFAAFEAVSGEVYKKVRLPRGLSAWDGTELDHLNQGLPFALRLHRLLPFAEVEVEMREDPQSEKQGTAVGFMLKSPMFQVTEWLHTRARAEERMGPALLRIIEGELPPKTPPLAVTKPKAARPTEGQLLVYRVATGDLAAQFSLADLKRKPVKFEAITIQVLQAYQRAVVSANHLSEGDDGKLNPALELRVTSGAQQIREVAYAQFPQFSLHKDGIGGFKFEYRVAGIAEETAPVKAASSEAANVIEFAVANSSDQVQVRLLKNGQEVLRQAVAPGESVQTPWMGMVLTLGSVQHGVVPTDQVREVEPREKEPLPRGALQVGVSGDGGERTYWLSEDESREVATKNGPLHLRFGADYFALPFRLRLLKFTKTDYPGSQMAQEYESQVEIEGESGTHQISMNQPLKKEGYTLYQSSYDVGPGRPTVSIFSVNRDPGRFWKYLGSLVMSLGIIIFTLHRSRLARDQRKAK